MSVTSGLGSFNKDKVANKFGIQLKPKDTNKQSLNLHNIETENKTTNDFSLQNPSNGFRSNTNLLNLSKPITKTLENSLKSKSNIELLSTSMHNQQRDSLNLNDNHSTLLTPVKSNSQSSSNILIPSDTIKTSSLTSIDQSKSLESSSIKRTTISPSSKRPSVPTTLTKSEAEIEHLKDQPLYKRQLSKTLDNATSMINKSKHHHEPTTLATIR